MSDNFDFCIKSLLFASKIIGLNHDVVVNTNIYRKNLCQCDLDDNPILDTDNDFYTIKANPKITVNSIAKLFEHIKYQFATCPDPLYTYISDFKYNKKLDRYYLTLSDSD